MSEPTISENQTADGDAQTNDERQCADTAYSTADAIELKLLRGEAKYCVDDLARLSGCDEESARSYWRAMGFTQPAPHDRIFTDMDVHALREWTLTSQKSGIDETTSQSLIRAQSHLADRLALWQVEAMVEDLTHRFSLDDTTARLLVLDRIPELLEPLEDQLRYAWRRQMAALINNTSAEVSLRGLEEADPDAYPLDRSLGFVDLVSYTRSSAQLGSHELAHLIQTFELVARDVVTSLGGRVVKTIGDCVLFVANSLLTAADIACALITEIDARDDLLMARASLVRGRVVSRSGDIFGPPVNLASRIADVATSGQILMDATSATDLKRLDRRNQFKLKHAKTVELRGVGMVDCFELARNNEN